MQLYPFCTVKTLSASQRHTSLFLKKKIRCITSNQLQSAVLLPCSRHTVKSILMMTEQDQSWGFRNTRFVLVSTTLWLTSSSSVADLWRFFANFFFMLPTKLSYLQKKKHPVRGKEFKIKNTSLTSPISSGDCSVTSQHNTCKAFKIWTDVWFSSSSSDWTQSVCTSEPSLHLWRPSASGWPPLVLLLPPLDSSEPSVSVTHRHLFIYIERV